MARRASRAVRRAGRPGPRRTELRDGVALRRAGAFARRDLARAGVRLGGFAVGAPFRAAGGAAAGEIRFAGGGRGGFGGNLGGEARAKFYRQLLRIAADTLGDLDAALPTAAASGASWSARWLECADHCAGLLKAVAVQTARRVLLEENVPAAEKIVSLFEPHTDIIRKGGRETLCGHKINLATGWSGLVLDVVVESGNPADSARCLPMLERHREHCGKPPTHAAFDGGHASADNLKHAREMGVAHALPLARPGALQGLGAISHVRAQSGADRAAAARIILQKRPETDIPAPEPHAGSGFDPGAGQPASSHRIKPENTQTRAGYGEIRPSSSPPPRIERNRRTTDRSENGVYGQELGVRVQIHVRLNRRSGDG